MGGLIDFLRDDSVGRMNILRQVDAESRLNSPRNPWLKK